MNANQRRQMERLRMKLLKRELQQNRRLREMGYRNPSWVDARRLPR